MRALDWMRLAKLPEWEQLQTYFKGRIAHHQAAILKSDPLNPVGQRAILESQARIKAYQEFLDEDSLFKSASGNGSQE